MTKERSEGGSNPFPKWVQWAAYFISNSVQFVGGLTIIGAFAIGLTYAMTRTLHYAMTRTLHPGVVVLSFLVVGIIQIFLWVIGDDIRKSMASRKGSDDANL